MKANVKKIMSTAWTIAREGADKFGGKVREYFSTALRIAWAESRVRTIGDMIPDLERMGFRRWTKGSYDRMYINATDRGLEVEYYNSGNPRYAEFQGYHVSNTEARSMLYAKTYIDLNGKLISDSYELFKAVCELLGIEAPSSDRNVVTVAPIAV